MHWRLAESQKGSTVMKKSSTNVDFPLLNSHHSAINFIYNVIDSFPEDSSDPQSSRSPYATNVTLIVMIYLHGKGIREHLAAC
jgi:hypothetical protein